MHQPTEARPGRTASLWSRWADTVQRAAVWIAIGALLLTLVFAFGVTRLKFSTSQDTMISSTSRVYHENLRYQGAFGGEVMVVVFHGDVRRLATPANRTELARVERELARTGRFHSIVGPDTNLQFAAHEAVLAGTLAVNALQRDQAAAKTDAEREALAKAFTLRTSADTLRLAAAGPRTLDNPRFVSFLLFDEHGAVRAPLAPAFPDARHALMVLTLQGNMSIDEQGKAAADTTRVVDGAKFAGVTTMVTGSAALLKEVNDKMRSDMATTGALAVVVMGVVLLTVFRARWRLMVLPLVIVGIVWAFGAIGYLGIPLTMVTISGLPILIGLGVDFAVQVHSRYEEEAHEPGRPLSRALSGLGPALGAAMVAAVVGFLALRISSVPMIRQFGVMLGVGAAVLLASVLVWVPLVLVWRDRHGARPLAARRRFGVERLVGGLTTSAGAHPAVVVVIALMIAGTGLVAQHHTTVESDPEHFVPQHSRVLTDLRTLRDIAGSSASLGVMVEAPNVMRPDVLAWMATYETRELARHPGQLLSSTSVASITHQLTDSTPTPQDVQAVLAVAPADTRRLLLDSTGTRAQMLFSIGHLSLNAQDRLIQEMRADVDAPKGVTVTASGLVVVGIATVHALERGQSTMTFAALGAVLLWLLLWLRSLRKSLLIVLPVITAVGASSLAIMLLGITVSALGALSSALVIAICTEFSILVLTRYEEERAAGHAPEEAMATASLRIGRAFTASGLTTAGGFAVLALSGFPLLSSFGTVVAINVVAAMMCALVIMPPLLRLDGAALQKRARRPGRRAHELAVPPVDGERPTATPELTPT